MTRFFNKTHKDKQQANSIDLTGLRQQLDQTKEEIDTARNHFEQAVDPILIDCYIYEINAAQLRYQFLLRYFKAMENRRTLGTMHNQSQEVTKHEYLV